MVKTKTKQEATEGQAAVFANRLSTERDKTAFGTPTKAIMKVLEDVKNFLESGAYKKDKSFQDEWSKLRFEIEQLYSQANNQLVVAAKTGNRAMADSQQELLGLLSACLNAIDAAAGVKENPSGIDVAGEQPPQLGAIIASPRVYTGKAGTNLETTLPDQFQQGISEANQEAARLKLQAWFNAYENGGNVAKAGKAFYNFLKENVGPNQLNAMLCGTATGAACTNIKKLFESGNLSALMDGEYPISETLRTALEEASRTSRFIVSNVNISAEAGFKLGDITELGVRAGGEYQVALTRRRQGTAPATEELENLFGGEIGPFLQLQLGRATQLRGDAGVGYGQLEGGVFFPAQIKLSSNLGTTEGTALFFDIYGRGKFGLDLNEFRQMQAGADSYLILFQVGEKQFGIFTSADIMNVKGKTGEFTFNVTNVQLNAGPQAQTVINGWLVAFQAGPAFVFPIQGPEDQTTYGLHLGTMFQKGDFRGGIDLTSPNLFNPGSSPISFSGNLMLGFTFGPKKEEVKE